MEEWKSDTDCLFQKGVFQTLNFMHETFKLKIRNPILNLNEFAYEKNLKRKPKKSRKAMERSPADLAGS